MDYLLWGIPWIVVQIMLADAARDTGLPQKTDPDSGYDDEDDESEKRGSAKKVIHRELKSKEDIKNYIKGII